MNKTIRKLLHDNIITQDEYNILFEDKANWLNQGYSSSEIHRLADKAFTKEFEKLLKEQKKYEDYKKALAKTINIQSKFEKIDLSHIQFINYHFYENMNTMFSFSNCKFYGTTSFMKSTLHKKVYFDNAIFYGYADFKNVTFEHYVNFKVTTFKDEANFWKATFNDDTNFRYATFQGETIFQHAIFNEVDFSYSKAKSYIDFSESNFQKINLENSHFVNAKFLNLQNKQGKHLYKENFSNKESARIIKDHFEKQNNIIEANKYFALEQNKYLEELKKSIHKNHYKDFLVLWLNKYVSYFGTDWMRPLLSMFIFGYLASLGYGFFQIGTESIDFTNSKLLLIGAFLYSLLVYYFYHKKLWVALIASILVFASLLLGDSHLQDTNNNISKLINPLNIFKPKVNYFENIAIYGMLVKLGMSVLIYQFIMAFRQNTRRK